MTKISIGFVFTNYNNSFHTNNLLDSISKIKELNEKKVVIVDNKSTENEIKKLKQILTNYDFTHLITNNKNEGYFRGLKSGVSYLREKTKIDLIVIGNNDLFFKNNFYLKIKSRMELFSKYPVVCPSIVTLKGIHQNPHVIEEISYFRKLIWDLYYSNYILAKIILKINNIFSKFSLRNDVKQSGVEQEILQGYGACYILTPIFFNHFKNLWAPTFLMEEEFFLRTQISTKDFKKYYCPDFVVEHVDHGTIGNIPSKSFWKIARDAHVIYKNVRQNRVKFPKNLNSKESE